MGFILALLFFQVISLCSDINYLKSSINLYHSTLQGSFEEGFSFIIKYMNDVENKFGFIWLLGFSSFLIFVLVHKNDEMKKYKKFFILSVYTLCAYLYYAFNVYYLHNMVFYGRIIHQFIPILIISTFIFIDVLFKIFKRKVGIVLVAGSILNLSFFYVKASNVAYPLDLINKYRINTKASNYYYSSLFCRPYTAYDTVSFVNKYALLNFAIYTKVFPNKLSTMQYKDTIVYVPHFQNLKSFQYEGMTIVDREYFDNHPSYIGVFK